MNPVSASSAAVALPWVERVDWQARLLSRNLPASERAAAASFARDGYVIIDLLDPEFPDLVRRIRGRLEPELQKHSRVHDAWRSVPQVRRLAILPQVTGLLRMLYGREPIPFQTLHFRSGSEQHSHSDALHFHSLPHRFLAAAWIALEDVGPESGPLHVYPGSHRFPVWEPHDLGLPPGTGSYRQYEEDLQTIIRQLGLQKRVLTLRKGQAVIWAANLLHGGEPIQNPASTRWSQVTHYFFADCLYYSPMRSDPYAGDLRLIDVTDIRTGRAVRHVYAGTEFRPSADQQFWMRPSVGSFVRAVAARGLCTARRIIGGR